MSAFLPYNVNPNKTCPINASIYGLFCITAFNCTLIDIFSFSGIVTCSFVFAKQKKWHAANIHPQIIATNKYPFFALWLPSFPIKGTVIMLIIPIAIIAATEREVLIFARSSMSCVIAPQSVPYGIFTHVYPSTSRQYVIIIQITFAVSGQSGCAQNVNIKSTAVMGAATSSHGR